jgi:hypothetical protein
MWQRIAIVGAPRAAIEVMRAVIVSEIGKSQAVVRGIAALSVAPAVVEAQRDLAVLEVLPASEGPAAAVAGGNAELSDV